MSAQATKSGLEVPITGAICKLHHGPHDRSVLSVPQCQGADPCPPVPKQTSPARHPAVQSFAAWVL